jgi:uncharacterized protein YdhG (YjbR/CyaY superfamily)
MKMIKANTVDEYIAAFPVPTQAMLRQMRAIIKKNAPEAEEGIGYGMPAYKLYKRPLVYFAGYENHIGFYATPTGQEAFKVALSKYKQGKGSVQFPSDEKLPEKLITDIVKFRVQENKEKYGSKNKTK